VTPGKLFFVFTGQAGALGQVSDFKIEPVPVDMCFHVRFSLIVHDGPLYQRPGFTVNTTPKKQPGLLSCQTVQQMISEAAWNHIF
jgi:hypothetical protein